MWRGQVEFMVVLYVFWIPQKLAFTLLFVLSLTGTKINQITGAALASCLAKAEKLAALK